jgi:hypothetical protein
MRKKYSLAQVHYGRRSRPPQRKLPRYAKRITPRRDSRPQPAQAMRSLDVAGSLCTTGLESTPSPLKAEAAVA